MSTPATPNPVIGAIWAQGINQVIGQDGAMPWSVPEDLKHFKAVTAGHPVVMGRRTWESFPAKFRPLPGRSNIVLTRDRKAHDALRQDGALPVATFEEALELASVCDGAEQIWIIGGGQVYAQAMDVLDLAVITRLRIEPDGDTRAPQLTEDFNCNTLDPAEGWHHSAGGVDYRFETWTRPKGRHL
ncbi:dihydrofolate reductase [Glutamicibacter sp. X7]